MINYLYNTLPNKWKCNINLQITNKKLYMVGKHKFWYVFIGSAIHDVIYSEKVLKTIPSDNEKYVGKYCFVCALHTLLTMKITTLKSIETVCWA